MSYIFNVRADSKAEAVSRVGEELDKVAAAMPVHAKDREQAAAAVGAFIALLDEPSDGNELSVSVNGSMLHAGAALRNVDLGVSVSLMPKAA